MFTNVDDAADKVFQTLKRHGESWCPLAPRLRVVFPSGCRVGDPEDRARRAHGKSGRTISCAEANRQLQWHIMRTFGGFTRFDATGGYHSSLLNRDIIEPVRVYDIAHECSDTDVAVRFFRMMLGLAEAAGQDSIAVSRDLSEFVAAPPIATPPRPPRHPLPIY